MVDKQKEVSDWIVFGFGVLRVVAFFALLDVLEWIVKRMLHHG